MKPAAVFYLFVAAFFFVVTCAAFLPVPYSEWMLVVLVVTVSVIGK